MIGIPLLLRQTDVKEIQVASSESAKQKVISAFSPQKDSVLLADKILPQAPEEDILQVKPEVHESAVLAELEGKILSHQASLRNTENPLKENMGDIVMKSDDIALNELVVTGHGTQRKRTITGVATLSKEIHPTFGETEFKQYFEEHYDKTICKNRSISAQISFYVSNDGRISEIQINELSCPTLETEIKRLLLGSPLWSKRNRKVVLNLEL